MALNIEKLFSNLSCKLVNIEGFNHHVQFESSGISSRFMFFSGIHLDEKGASVALKNWFEKNEGVIPDTLKVFQANPESLKRKKRGVTRWTWHGPEIIDANRYFGNESGNYWVAEEIKTIAAQHPNLKCVFSFHEEADKKGYRKKDDGRIETFIRDTNSFYMYDAFNAEESTSDEIMLLYNSLASTLTEQGFSLYSGFDDYKNNPKETVQLNPVDKGYCPQASDKNNFLDGSFENWVITQGMKRSFVFEIPSRISEERKQLMIKIIFEKFIIPFLNQVCPDLNLPNIGID